MFYLMINFNDVIIRMIFNKKVEFYLENLK